MLAFVLSSSLLLSGSQTTAGDGYGPVDFANSGAPAAQKDFLEALARTPGRRLAMKGFEATLKTKTASGLERNSLAPR